MAMHYEVTRTIRLTLRLNEMEFSLAEDEALALARQILQAIGKTEKSRVQRNAAQRAPAPVPAVTGEWSAEDTRFVIDERAKGKSWVLIGELLGRTASECKAHHDRTTVHA